MVHHTEVHIQMCASFLFLQSWRHQSTFAFRSVSWTGTPDMKTCHRQLFKIVTDGAPKKSVHICECSFFAPIIKRDLNPGQNLYEYYVTIVLYNLQLQKQVVIYIFIWYNNRKTNYDKNINHKREEYNYEDCTYCS